MCILEQEFQRCKRHNGRQLSVIMCDIDFFKQYNDHYGHLKGDECLQVVADTLRKSLARPSDMCARYGGEEFVIVLPDTTTEGASHVANRVRKKLANVNIEHRQSSIAMQLTMSFGISGYSPQIKTAECILTEADKALYMAKENGRNCVVTFKLSV